MMYQEIINLLDDCDTAFATLFIGADHGITPQANKACRDVAVRIQKVLYEVKNREYTHLITIDSTRFRAINRPDTQEDNYAGIKNRFDIYDLAGGHIGKIVEYFDGSFAAFTPIKTTLPKELITVVQIK